jgi:hypothetical protein
MNVVVVNYNSKDQINFLENLLIFKLQKKPLDSRRMVKINVKKFKNMPTEAQHLSCHDGKSNVELHSTLRPVIFKVQWLESEHSAYC